MSDPKTIRIITAAEPPESDPIEGERGMLRDVGETFGLAAKTATEAAVKTLNRGTEIPAGLTQKSLKPLKLRDELMAETTQSC